MKKLILPVAAAAALMAAACGGGNQNEFTQRDATAIRQDTESYTKAFNAKQVPDLLGLYADNSTFMPPNEPIIRGRDALKNFYTDLFSKGATDLKLTVNEVSGSGPIAYQSGTYEMSYKPAKGGDEGRDRGKYLFVLRNMAGTWRYEYSMWNSDLPAQGN